VAYRKALTKYAFYGWGAMARENGDRKNAGLRVRSTFEIEDYPKYAYAYPDASTRFREAFFDIVLLYIWNGLFFFLEYLTFLKYDVR
jgi:hypothetical protein